MKHSAETLEESLYFRLLRDAADAIKNHASSAEVEPLIVELAAAIQRFPFPTLKRTIVDLVRAVPDLRPTPKTVRALAPLAQIYDLDLCTEVARLFSNVATENIQARQHCEELLELREYVHKQPDMAGGVFAALGLARCGDLRKEVWQELGGFLYREEWKGDRAEKIDAHSREAVHEFLATAPPAAVELMNRWVAGEEANSETGENNHLPGCGVKLLKAMAKEEKIAAALLPMLGGDAYDRLQAAEWLLDVGIAEDKAVETLIQLINKDDDHRSSSALNKLKQSRKAEEKVIAILGSRLHSEDLHSRWLAVHLLIEMGKADSEIEESLRRMLREDRFHRNYAVSALIEMGKADEQIVELFIPMLHNQFISYDDTLKFLDEDAKERIATALVADLELLVADRDKAVREGEWDVFGEDDWDDSGNKHERFKAAERLLTIGKAQDKAIETFLDLLNDWYWKSEVVGFFHQIGSANERIIQKIRSGLKIEDFEAWESEFLYESALCLADLGFINEDVVEAMLRCTKAEIKVYMPVFQRIQAQQTLRSAEIAALRDLFTDKSEDYAAYHAREWLYEWLWNTLEAEEA